ncbi:DNA methyltransferase [Amycolatopsis sp. NPDC051372]|uniref:DNA methyltransferase n=1 Tax=Amycolatopsis sp. NPDC051372 TaxID=3155669 RepID=UPI0034400B5F
MRDDRTPPLSVWPTGQRDPLTQLRDVGCVPETDADAERIPPAVAAHAIATYTRPGDLVVDPDCGAGTVLNAALHAGRHALGLTPQSRWWTLARANVTAAKHAGAWPDGAVLDAHPQALGTARAAGLIGRVALILTSLRTGPLQSGDPDPAKSTPADFATPLRNYESLLRDGGHLVVVARPHRHPDGELADLTTQLVAGATAAGLVPVERCVALTAELRGSRLVTRASLTERRSAARARSGGSRTALVAHHEVLVFELAHDAVLAAEGTARASCLTEVEITSPAVRGASYSEWMRATHTVGLSAGSRAARRSRSAQHDAVSVARFDNDQEAA